MLIKEGHIFSYSQLSSFDECPYSYYLQKIESVEDTKDNAFAQQGTLVHNLIDEWAKGEILPGELPEEFARRYPEYVTLGFPKQLQKHNYHEKSYQACYKYFQEFDEFKGYKILESEYKFETLIGNDKLAGIIDMVLEDEKTKELIVLDHKSKSLKAFKKAERDMYRQLYLYSKAVFEKYGRYPSQLIFNLFKEDGMRMVSSFNKDEYEQVLIWAETCIHKIKDYSIIEWLEVKKQDMFCTDICSVRNHCMNGTYRRKG